MNNKKIDPNKLKTRDILLLSLIKGATKASVTPDRKKKLNKNKCRSKVNKDND